MSVSMKKNSRIGLMSPAMLARTKRLVALVSFVGISRQRRRDLVPRFALEWGLSLEKVQEYVSLLLDAGRLEISNDGMVQVVDRKSHLKGKSSQ